MNECICCRDRLIRHLNHRRMYWFCPTCRQEMPNPDLIKIEHLNKLKHSLTRSLVVGE